MKDNNTPALAQALLGSGLVRACVEGGGGGSCPDARLFITRARVCFRFSRFCVFLFLFLFLFLFF